MDYACNRRTREKAYYAFIALLTLAHHERIMEW